MASLNETLKNVFKKLKEIPLSLVLVYQESITRDYVLIISGPTLNCESQFDCIDFFSNFIYKNIEDKKMLLKIKKMTIVDTHDEIIDYLVKNDINSLNEKELKKLLGSNIVYKSVEALIKNPKVLRECKGNTVENQA